VATSLSGLGVYLGVLYAMREFTRKDVDFFMETLSPFKMVQYVKREMKK